MKTCFFRVGGRVGYVRNRWEMFSVHARKGTHTVPGLDVETRRTYCKMCLTETCVILLYSVFFATFFASMNSTYVQQIATATPAEMHIGLRVKFQLFLSHF